MLEKLTTALYDYNQIGFVKIYSDGEHSAKEIADEVFHVLHRLKCSAVMSKIDDDTYMIVDHMMENYPETDDDTEV